MKGLEIGDPAAPIELAASLAPDDPGTVTGRNRDPFQIVGPPAADRDSTGALDAPGVPDAVIPVRGDLPAAPYYVWGP